MLAGLFVGLGAYTFLYAKGYSYLTNNPEACANCHVMQAQYEAWLKSSHHVVAVCNDCHTPHNIIGKYAVKANNGFWHSFYFTTGYYPDTIEITKLTTKWSRMPAGDAMKASRRPLTAMSCTEGPGVWNAPAATIPLGTPRLRRLCRGRF
jgi:cytochrome c nitrite reductase small subunit